MEISSGYADKFSNVSRETDIIQDKLYSDLLYLYFQKNLKTNLIINAECIKLKTKTKETEGCLLINSNHKANK